MAGPKRQSLHQKIDNALIRPTLFYGYINLLQSKM